MNALHQSHLAEYADKIGVSALAEIAYRIAKGDNLMKMTKEYDLELCDLRYFMMIPNEVTTFVYEKQHVQNLRLYQREAA